MFGFSLSSLYIGCKRSLKLSPTFRHLNDENDEIKPMDTTEAMKFPLIASAFLFTLYIFIKFINQDLVVVVLSVYFTLIGIEI